MLQSIVRMLRPAPPPVEVAQPASQPLYEGMTTAEYLQLIRSRVAARQEEQLAIRAEMVRVERARARIAAMKAANWDRECIRSSRFITPKEK